MGCMVVRSLDIGIIPSGGDIIDVGSLLKSNRIEIHSGDYEEAFGPIFLSGFVHGRMISDTLFLSRGYAEN